MVAQAEETSSVTVVIVMTVVAVLMALEAVLVALSVEVAFTAVDVDAADVHALDADILGLDALATETAATEALEAVVLAEVNLTALVDGDLLGDRDLAAASTLNHNLLGDDDALRKTLSVLLVVLADGLDVLEDSVPEKLALGEFGLHDLDHLASVNSGAEDFATDDSALAAGDPTLDADDLLDADALDHTASSAFAAELLDGDILSDGDDTAPTKGEDDARAGLVPSEARCGRREKS